MNFNRNTEFNVVFSAAGYELTVQYAVQYTVS